MSRRGWVVAVLLVSGCTAPMETSEGPYGPGGPKGDEGGIASGVVLLAAGPSHTCASLGDRGLYCWGRNEDGPLGNGRRYDSASPVPVDGAPSDVQQLALGSVTSCAATSGGDVYCWGAGLPKQIDERNADLDNAAINVNLRATRVDGVRANVSRGGRAIAVGGGHACVIEGQGTVSCFGGNWAGQLGDGTTTERATPAPIAGLTDAIDLDAYGATTCAVRSSGEVVCWGESNHGAIPSGATRTPVAIEGIAGATQVDVGDESVCAVTSEGQLYCWGSNFDGQIGKDPGGRARYDAIPAEPVTEISGLGTVTSVAVGGGHACAVRSAGDVVCFGENGAGQLGVVGLATGLYDDGDGGLRFDPTPPNWFLPINAGQEAVLDAENRAWRAAYDAHYQQAFGHGRDVSRSVQPNLDRLPVTGLSSVSLVVAGNGYSCAQTGAGRVQCWGALRGDGERNGQRVDAAGTRRFSYGPDVSEVTVLPDGCGDTGATDPFDWEGDNASRGGATMLGKGFDDGRFENTHRMVDAFNGGGIHTFRMSGNLYPSGDVDWYAMDIVDESSFETLDPRVEITGSANVCMYYEANATWSTSITCYDGASRSDQDIALADGTTTQLRGCCGASTFSMYIDAAGTTDESGRLYVSSSSGPAATCSSYSLSFAL